MKSAVFAAMFAVASACGPNNEYSNIAQCLLNECPRINIADCVACVSCLGPTHPIIEPQWQPVVDAMNRNPFIREATLTVTPNGEHTPVFNYELGRTNLDTLQNNWSSTKLVAATALMKEVEKGTLDLDEPISTYLSYWTTDESDRRSRITLRNLLGFSSGYVNLFQIQGCVRPTACIGGSIQECVRAIYDEIEHVHEPGKEVHYNSLHLQIAGAVVEAAAGVPIIDIFKTNVFEPAGMDCLNNRGGCLPQWGTRKPMHGRRIESFTSRLQHLPRRVRRWRAGVLEHC